MDFLAQVYYLGRNRRWMTAGAAILLAVVWLAAAPYCLMPQYQADRSIASVEEAFEMAEPLMEEVDALRPVKLSERVIPEDATAVLSIRQSRDVARFPLQERWGAWRLIWILAPILFFIIGGGIFSLATHAGIAQRRRLAKPGILQIGLASIKFLVLASFLVTVIGGLALLIFALFLQWWDIAFWAALVTVIIMGAAAVFGLRYLLAIWYIFCEEFKLGKALHPTSWQKFIAALPPRFAWYWLKRWALSTAEIFVVVILASALLSAILMLFGAFGVGGLTTSWAKYAQYIYLICFCVYLVLFVGQAFYLGRSMRLLKERSPYAKTRTLSLTPTDLV